MDHNDFLKRLDDHSHLWGVRRFHPAVRTVLGATGTRRLFLAYVLLLIPCVSLGVFGVIVARYGLLVWCLLSTLGFLVGNPGPTGIGCITCLLLAAIGSVISRAAGVPHLYGGVIVGATWFGSCAIRGVTMLRLEEQLRRSPDCFAKLDMEDNLLFVPKASSRK